ncbi:MAG: 5-formyltetrahydrofolate cyclo-ligase [Burkholderiales bacterium]
MQAKVELRKAILARRDGLGAEARVASSDRIARRVIELPGFRQADVVLAYVSFGSEFDTTDFVRATLAHGKILLLPRVNRQKRRLDLFRVADPAKDLISGTWNIREPDPERCPSWNDETVDFVLVPGVAFDAQGNRLGYGGGFYDCLLEDLGPFPSLIAAAFASQVVDRVPTEEHDIAVDVVVTEEKNFVRNDFNS